MTPPPTARYSYHPVGGERSIAPTSSSSSAAAASPPGNLIAASARARLAAVKHELYDKQPPAVRRRRATVALISLAGSLLIVLFFYATSSSSSPREKYARSPAALSGDESGEDAAPWGNDNDEKNEEEEAAADASTERVPLKILTWNVGAINNNPFEYWLTIANEPMYDEMLNKFALFVTNPTGPKQDGLISTIFTNEMFERLCEEMKAKRIEFVDEVKKIWADDLSKRRATEFLKDASIGRKRLVSMPDRFTNTVMGPGGKTLYRPTSINCYDGERIKTVGDWYKKWIKFMFREKINAEGQSPSEILRRIPRSKYPALSEEEERISIPYQILVIAIFDAIQVRMLNRLGGTETWQEVRAKICAELNVRKTDSTVRLLKSSLYNTAMDVMFLQELSQGMMERVRRAFQEDFLVMTPSKPSKSDQNSVILINKRQKFFKLDTVRDVTYDKVLGGGASPNEKTDLESVSDGDLLVVELETTATSGGGRGKRTLALASFHGDTNGLATVPVTLAVGEGLGILSASASRTATIRPGPRAEATTLVFGLDANTYERKKKGEEVQLFTDYSDFLLRRLGWSHAWGPNADPSAIHTTRNARTFMQPQLSKAAANKGEVDSKGDANPKDFLVCSARGAFSSSSSSETSPRRDNTGEGRYIENMVFPTLEFPSDHAILSGVVYVPS